jgi:ATP-dependent DNA ligase
MISIQYLGKESSLWLKIKLFENQQLTLTNTFPKQGSSTAGYQRVPETLYLT